MTVQVPTADEGAAALKNWLRIAVKPSGLEVLSDLLTRTISRLPDHRRAETGDGDIDPLVRRVIKESMLTFINNGGNRAAAEREMAPLLWEIGERHARRGRSQDELNRAFVEVEKATHRGLPFVMNRNAVGRQAELLHTALSCYIRRLHRHTIIGWERAQVLHSIPQPHPADDTASRRMRPSDPDRLASFVELYGVALHEPYRAIVTTGDTLGPDVLALPEALTANDLSEVLLPAAWTAERLADLLTHQAVIGPVVPLGEARASAQLALRGAELLRDGLATDARIAVPCTDLTGVLLIDGNPQLAELVVTKHLGPLEALSARRRWHVTQVLLTSLECGKPLTDVARSLGIPTQTAHSRMKSAKELLGDAVANPEDRLELIVALHAVLPRWRTEAERCA